MFRKPIHALLIGTIGLVVGLAVTAQLNWQSVALADQIWSEKSLDEPGLDPNGPVSMTTFSKLAKSLSPGVVNVTVDRSGHTSGSPFSEQFRRFFEGRPPSHGSQGIGTGFIIHPDGWLLTNDHVVKEASKITIQLVNGSKYEAKVVGSDTRTDVALLKIRPREKLSVVPLGDSDRMEIGSWVLAIGNPFGLNHTVTAGIVSAKGRKDVNPDGKQVYANFIQTDASINPGNSGGPLINIRGEVIGINTAINPAGQGIGFAIPINMVKVLVPQLQSGEVRRSWLGVMIQEVTPGLASSRGMDKPRGALVSEVMANGPALKAGIRPGDIIIRFDGKPIAKANDLPWIASNAGIGTTVQVTVWRNSRQAVLAVTMGTLPSDPTTAGRIERSSPSETISLDKLGIHVAPLSKSRAKKLGIGAGKRLIITQVDAGGPARWGGLQAGDVVLEVNDREVRALSTLQKHVGAHQAGAVISFLVQRGQRQIFVAFSLE